MGLPRSPLLLQKAVNAVLELVRADSQNAFMWAHIDDIFIAAATRADCKKVLRNAVYKLHSAGFYLSCKKCIFFEPSQAIDFCGFNGLE